ncbi:hypothetical protein LOTGIDRAFT_228463 [Lottia gigantea]|uniref:Uncharacterized protein n=1 Tax=Lottia gigantea TaxID=225164 RepID=V4ALH6_LOTGI|nr:hypothetical protein LOTGIDRAFT_228463 [Lottia gigantea]ESO97967.1 hypothetical protein LOTGIDRAFT_228463 [Lottia gigantea]
MVPKVNLRQFLCLLTVFIYSISANKQKHRNCFQNFNHKIQRCLEPFSKLFRTYQQTQDESSFSNIVKKHICFEYEKMLLCMHSTLTHCPTLRNIKRVQEKLGADWVNNVNGLCRIPATPHTEVHEVEPQQNSILNHYESQTVKPVVNKPQEEVSEKDISKEQISNEDSETWEMFEAKDKVLEKQQNEIWNKLKNTWRQRAKIMKQRLHLVLKSSNKGNNYNTYNIFYNVVPRSVHVPQRLRIGTKFVSHQAHSSASTSDITVSVFMLCLSPVLIGLH